MLLKNDPAPPGYGFGKLLPVDLRKCGEFDWQRRVLGPYADLLQYGNYSRYAGKPAGVDPPGASFGRRWGIA